MPICEILLEVAWLAAYLCLFVRFCDVVSFLVSRVFVPICEILLEVAWLAAYLCLFVRFCWKLLG